MRATDFVGAAAAGVAAGDLTALVDLAAYLRGRLDGRLARDAEADRRACEILESLAYRTLAEPDDDDEDVCPECGCDVDECECDDDGDD